MADTVNTQVIEQGPRNYVALFTNNSDGTGESAVTKIDPILLSPQCARLVIRKITFSTIGMGVIISFDGAVDRPAYVIPADFSDEVCFDKTGGIAPPYDLASPTGKILFTTSGHSAGDYYSVQLELVKKYEAVTL